MKDIPEVVVPNESREGPKEPFSELLRIQTEFCTRLAEETVRYLRRLQGAAAPAAPGTVLQPTSQGELAVSGKPGTIIELNLEVENCQRVHCVASPTFSTLVSSAGVTWFPEAEPVPALLLIAPKESAKLIVRLPLPSNLPDGIYRGAILLPGFRQGAIAIVVNVPGGLSSVAKNKTRSRGVKPAKKAQKKKASAAKGDRRRPRRRP